MGLYADIQSDLRDAFNSDLSDAYKDFTVTKVLSNVYDPSTGVNTNTEDTKSFKGIILKNKKESEIDNDEEFSNFDVLVLDSDKPFDFGINQKIIHNSIEHRIVDFKTDPITATWTLYCIDWN